MMPTLDILSEWIFEENKKDENKEKKETML